MASREVHGNGTAVTRRRRLGTVMLAVGLLAAVLVVTDSVTNAEPAQARCNGEGNYATSTYWSGGVRRVSERPLDETCDGNNYYRATLTDVRTDGNVVQVRIRDGNSLPVVVAETGSSTIYRWRDVNNNSVSFMQLCAVPDYGCGFGMDADAQGTNFGY